MRTDFDIGQEVYCFSLSAPLKVRVVGINIEPISPLSREQTVSYSLMASGGGKFTLKERDVFACAEHLMDSFQEKIRRLNG